MIPLWTVPLLLATLLALGGWIGERNRSRSRRRRIRRSWDVPDGVTAQDVAALAGPYVGKYVHHLCGDRACVNPEHLVIVDAEAHS